MWGHAALFLFGCDIHAARMSCRINRRVPFAATVAAVVLATAASCGPAPAATESSAASISAPEPGPAPAATDTRTIRVTAIGQAEGTPDAVVLMLGVEVTGTSTAEALSTLAARATTLTTFLRQYGIDDADVATTGLWAYPLYGDYSGTSPEVTGYQAGETFSVKVTDLGAAAPLLDGATFAVADALRLQGLSWVIDDSDALQRQARTAAIEQARRHAAELADAGGLRLGSILAIDEGGASTGSGYSGDMAAEGLPLAPGSATVSVQVTVTFAAE